MRSWLVVVALVGLAGCVLDDLDLEGRPCPCTDGYQCVDAGSGGVCQAARDGEAPADAGTDASTSDGAVPTCEPTSFRFEDGFEEGLIEAAGWVASFETNGSVDTVADPRHTGSASLQAEITAAGGTATPIGVWSDSVSSGDIWARAWLYVPASTSVSGIVPLSVGDMTNGYLHAWLGSENRLALVVGDEIPPTVSLASETYPVDEWFCLRLHAVVSDADGSAELFLGDGPEPIAPLGPMEDTRPDGDYSTVLAGIAHAQPEQGPAEIFVDDILVADAPIPCACP